MRNLILLMTLFLAACAPAQASPTAGAFLPVQTLTPLPTVVVTTTLVPTIAPTITPTPEPPVVLQAIPTNSPPQPTAPSNPGGGGSSGAPPAAPTAVVAAAPPLTNYNPPATIAEAEQRAIEINNQYRANAGLPPMIRDETVMNIARTRVQDMITRNYLGHFDPVSNVHLGRQLIAASGYAEGSENWYASSGVSLAAFTEQAMTWFINDPPHAAGILSPVYTHIGVGINDRNGMWIIVQNFARP